MNFKKEFEDRLGKAVDIDKYIEFVEQNEVKDCDIDGMCFELHHLLPKSIFPEFTNSDENIYRLDYNNHQRAHILLAKCYPIYEFIVPLNWFSIEKNEKYSLILSERAKKNWKIFKKSGEKYDNYVEKRKEIAKRNMTKGKKQYDSVQESHKVKWENASDEYRLSFSKKMKEVYKNKDVQKRHKEAIYKFTKTDKFSKLQSKLVKERWDNKSLADRTHFKKKMREINQNIEKREGAGKKIKAKWEDDCFREKMSQRKSKPKNIYTLLIDSIEIEVIGLDNLSSKTGLSPFILRKMIETTEYRKDMNGKKIKVSKNETN